MKQFLLTLVFVCIIKFVCLSQVFDISTGLALQSARYTEFRSSDTYTAYPNLEHTEKYTSLNWSTLYFRSSLIAAIFNDSKFIIGDYEGGGFGFGRTFYNSTFDAPENLVGKSHFQFVTNLDYGLMTRFRFSESSTLGVRFYFHWNKNRLRLGGKTDGYDCPLLFGVFGNIDKFMYGVDLNLKKDQQHFNGNWLNIEAKYSMKGASHWGIRLNFVNYEVNEGHNYSVPHEKKFTDIEVLYGFAFR